MKRARHLLAVALAIAVLGVAPGSTSLALFGEQSSAQVAMSADVLQPPTGLACSAGGATTCTASLISRPQLSWTATADTYAGGYRILRSTTSGSGYVQVGSVAGRATTTFTDTTGGLSLLTTYYYVVVSYAAAWTSVPSNQVAVTVLFSI